MQLINHRGYWGIFRSSLYWSDTLDELKVYPNALDMDADQYTELESGDCCAVVQYSDTAPKVMYLSSDKRVTLNEEYEMLQLLLKSVVLALVPKVVDIVSDTLSDTMNEVTTAVHNLLGSKSEPEEPEIWATITTKKSDTTKLTQYMYDFTIYAHTEWKSFNRQNPKNKKTMEELIDAINTYMGTNKSRTSLGRIWNGHINRDDLPVGTAYFNYPQKA